MDYSDLLSLQQREVDNNFLAVKESTDNIVQAPLVRDAARTRLKVLQIVNEVSRQIIDTFKGCAWKDDIRDPLVVAAGGVAVPGFTLTSGAKVPLAAYDDIVHAGNSRFGASNLGDAIKGLSSTRQVFSAAPSAEDKVTLAGQNYNSSVGSFAPALKITPPAGGYYKATGLFFDDGLGFLDSKGASSLIDGDIWAVAVTKAAALNGGPLSPPALDALYNKKVAASELIGPIPIPEYQPNGTLNGSLTSTVPIKDLQTINDRVSIAQYLLDETKAKLESSDLHAAAYSDLFDFKLALEDNNRKHYAAKVLAPFADVDECSAEGYVAIITHARFRDAESILNDLRLSYRRMEKLSRYFAIFNRA